VGGEIKQLLFKILQNCWKKDISGELPPGPDTPCLPRTLEKQWTRIGLRSATGLRFREQPSLLGSESWGNWAGKMLFLPEMLQISQLYLARAIVSLVSSNPGPRQSPLLPRIRDQLRDSPALSQLDISSPWWQGTAYDLPLFQSTAVSLGGREAGETSLFSQDFADPQPNNQIYQIVSMVQTKILQSRFFSFFNTKLPHLPK